MSKIHYDLKQEFSLVDKPDQLRVGVFLFSPTQPAWVFKILSIISISSFAKLTLMIMCDLDSGENQEPHPKSNLPFLWKFYAAFDNILYNRERKPGRNKNIIPLFQTCQVIKAKSQIKDGTIHLAENDILKIQEANLDLILYFGTGNIEEELIKSARFGIWPYCYWFHHWQTQTKIMEVLLDIFEYGEAILFKDPYTSTFPPKNLQTFRSISNSKVLQLLWKVIRQKTVNKLYFLIYRKRWEIMFQFNSDSPQLILDTNNFKRISPPIHQIYADPFPMKVEDKYYVFFEEMNVDDSHIDKLNGHISVLEIDPQKGPVGKIQKVLEKEYHLSYPFIFKWNDSFYMIPETHQNKTVELYRCLSFPTRWELCKVLMTGIIAVDVTVFEKDELWWLFASIPQATPPENEYDALKLQSNALELYYADNPLGPWVPHPQNPVKLDYSSTRPAGRIFEHKGSYIRPSQDCTPAYGYAVALNRIEKLTTNSYLEKEISRIFPNRKKGLLGLHTINFCEGLAVIDINRMRNKFFS